jgi:isochorismate synthase
VNPATEDASRSRAAERASWLDAGLDRAARTAGWTCVVLPASVADPSLLVTEGRSDGLAVWWAPDGEAIVGMGAAAILRGSGDGRWRDIRDQAAAVMARIEARMVAGEVQSSPHQGMSRPRFLGGLAFTPGAADLAPWTELGDAWFMLPRWCYVSDGHTAQLTLIIDREGARERARLRGELAAIEKALAAGRHAARPRARVTEVREDGAEWMACVADARDFINAGLAAKVVAARSQHLRLAEPVRAGDVLAALADRHPDCYRVLVAPQHTTWLAATPERLLRRSGNDVACDALAGSIPRRGETASEREALLGSGKERREHDLVVTGISEVLRQLGATVTHEAEPGVRSLRHVHHLATPITGHFAAAAPHVLEVAERLHPTPAVGGTPTATAIEWIRGHEREPRGWYAAPIGWFDAAGDGELAVGIRSGLLDGVDVHLWAGAGIVGASEPARELHETTVKLRALRGALGLDE